MLRFLVLLFLLSGELLYAQNPPLLSSDLTFENKGEEEVFLRADALLQKDYVQLLFGTYGEPVTVQLSQAEKKLDDCVERLRKKISGKSDAKQIRIIMEEVQRTFLVQYRLQTSFQKLFENGDFNCVSATALYAIICEKLDIPTRIVEVPQHVYLIAYPGRSDIAIEATSQQGGYFEFDESFVARAVSSLHKSKIISDTELKGRPVRELFNDYYFSKGQITLKELAGLQYSNFALYHTEKGRIDEALRDSKKAAFLFPANRNYLVLRTLLMQKLGKGNYKDEGMESAFVLLLRLHYPDSPEPDTDDFRSEFTRITDELMIDSYQPAKYHKLYNTVETIVKDSTLQKDFAFQYHFETARLGWINHEKDDLVYDHLKKAYDTYPDHAQLQKMIVAYFDERVHLSEDPAYMQEVMNKYEKTFPFVTSDPDYNSIRANSCLFMAYRHFALRESSLGSKKLAEFESIMSTSSALRSSPNMVEAAYSEAAGFYFKAGNYSKAKELLKKGLVYAPGNFGLERRLSAF